MEGYHSPSIFLGHTFFPFTMLSYSYVPPLSNCQIGDTPRGSSVVHELCIAFRRGWDFETLRKKFYSLELTSSLVDEVLLQMKEPSDAKRALGFFHWSAKTRGFDHSMKSYCIIVHILVRAKILRDARALLEAVLKKTEASCSFSLVDLFLETYNATSSRSLVFDLLVQTYSKLRMFDVALDVFCCLERHGLSLSLTSYNILIRAVSKSGKYSLAWKIYENMLVKGIYPNELVEVGRIDAGTGLLRKMLHNNMVPDTFSYSLIIYVKVKLGNSDSALEIYSELLRRGFESNPFVYTVFIGAYCLEGKIDEALSLMQEMEETGLKPYDETFNHLISGCSMAGRLEESITLCKKMVGMGLVPRGSAFNDMISKLCENKYTQQANSMLTLLLDMGFSPDECTYSHLICGYGREGNLQEVMKLYYEMRYREIPLGVLGFTSLVKSLLRCGELDKANRFIKIMKDKKLILHGDICEPLFDLYTGRNENTKRTQDEGYAA